MKTVVNFRKRIIYCEISFTTTYLNTLRLNDIPAVLASIKRILKPDGAFIGSLIGGNSLMELRHALFLAEQERRGGVSPVRQIALFYA